jgi:hypothetical protein
MKALIISYVLAVLATVATVAWALRGGRRAPEGAVVAYALILIIWWVVFFILLEVMR